MTYQNQNGNLIIKSHHNIIDDKKHQIVGHIEMGNCISSKSLHLLSKDTNIQLTSQSAPFESSIALLKSDIEEELVVVQTRDYYAAGAYIDTLDEKICYVAKFPKSLLQQTLRENRLQLFLLLVGVMILILTLLHFVFDYILAKPLDKLMDQIARVQSGDYTTTEVLNTNDELEKVSSNINSLASIVDARESSLKKIQKNLEYLFNHDILTTLPNRRFFEQKIDEFIQNAKSNNGKFALLFADINHFKEINDTLGHSMGDSLLKQISLTLNEFLPQGAVLARIGGDEFNILINIHRHDNKVEKYLQSVTKRFVHPFECEDFKLISSLSIGISIYPDDALNAEALVQKADYALTQTKENERGGYAFFTQNMAQQMNTRVKILQELKYSMENFENFQLYYQPKISLKSGKIVAVEALVRWNSPQQGYMCPADFIPIAEENGMILPLGKWILRQACSDFSHLLQEFENLEYISVNISAVQLRQGSIIGTIQQILSEFQIQKNQLELEITESFLATKDKQVIVILQKLRDFGIEIAIDDFGTGYSSLSYLLKLPVTRIKIDKSFIDELLTSKEDAAIVEAIIGLSRTFGMATTAEGVEELEQLNYLQKLGCDEIQGYFCSAPLDYEQLKVYLKKNCKESFVS